jgi:hypothetical protein
MPVLSEVDMNLRVLCLFLFTMPFWAYGQVPHSISGRIADLSGEPLPGVEVILENPKMEFERSYKTEKDGMYHFDCLEKGVYSLSFKLAGFIAERMENFTYSPPSSLEFNRELQLDPATEDTFIFPAAGPEKALVVIVRDNRTSDYLENAQVAIFDGDFRKGAPITNVCGNASMFLEPGKKYSVRISKDGFKEQVINLDMPKEPKRMNVRLSPSK